MSMNKGKAKAKPAPKKKGKGKSTAATAGIPKRGVMNRRKYNEAISGDTMSNYAMYKKGGKVGKIKKYQSKGEVDSEPKQGIVDKVLRAPGMAFAAGMKGVFKAAEKGAEMVKENAPAIKKAIKEGMNRLTDAEKPVGGYKKGGTAKTKKFAALAPPYDKVTYADKIAGAKKRAKKK